MRRKNETLDGIKLKRIRDLVESLGAEVESAKGHLEKIIYPGENVMPCALGPTTSFKKHVLPWLHHNFPRYSNTQIYQQLGRCYA